MIGDRTYSIIPRVYWTWDMIWGCTYYWFYYWIFESCIEDCRFHISYVEIWCCSINLNNSCPYWACTYWSYSCKLRWWFSLDMCIVLDDAPTFLCKYGGITCNYYFDLLDSDDLYEGKLSKFTIYDCGWTVNSTISL